MSRPLALSDAQLQIVHSGAFAIPLNWRSRFLEAVADRLIPLDQLTDMDVHVAVREAIARLNCTSDAKGICE